MRSWRSTFGKKGKEGDAKDILRKSTAQRQGMFVLQKSVDGLGGGFESKRLSIADSSHTKSSPSIINDSSHASGSLNVSTLLLRSYMSAAIP